MGKKSKSKYKRDKSFFLGSRLYHQADDGSKSLLTHFKTDKLVWKGILSRFSGKKDEIIISNIDECNILLSKVLNYYNSFIQRINPYISTPILLQTITDYYYEQEPRWEPIWLGTALKIATAYIWGNIFSQSTSSSSSISDIKTAIVLSSLLEQLEHLRDIYEIFNKSAVLFAGDGMHLLDKPTKNIFKQYWESFKNRGLLHRTLGDSAKVLIRKPGEALNAIIRVINGEAAYNQEIFDKTIFKEISSDEPMEFWVRLLVYLNCMSLCIKIRSQVTNSPMGISIFEPFGLVIPSLKNNNLFKKAMAYCFWKNTWYLKRINSGNVSAMIVEKPLLRITDQYDLFVSSWILVGDSLNWFVENAFMRYRNLEGVILSESLFRKCISEPFENNVIMFFRKNGFLVGKVNENGIWMASSMIELSHKFQEKIPGEIDVVAYHPQSNTLFVIECKVLSLFKKGAMRNIIYKIGIEDSEGFHSKLTKKIDWVKNSDLTKDYVVDKIIGLIVLDRFVPGMDRGEYTVIDFARLKKIISDIHNG